MKIKLIPFLLLLLGFSSCHETEEIPGHSWSGGEVRPMYGVTPIEYRQKSMVPKDTLTEEKILKKEDESR